MPSTTETDGLERWRPEYRMLPEPTTWSRPFWTGGATGKLLIHRCGACQRWFHPPGPACRHCRSRDVGPEPTSGRATLAAYTVNHHPWFPGFPPPYVVGIVELDEAPDVRLTTQIIGCEPDALSVGLAVHVVFERREDLWLPLFRPEVQ